MNELDFELLRLLHRDGRISNEALGRRLGLSGASVKAHLSRLSREGVLGGFGLRLAPQVFGCRMSILTGPEIMRGSPSHLPDLLADLPWSRLVCHGSGEVALSVWYRQENELIPVRKVLADLANRGDGISPDEVMQFDTLPDAPLRDRLHRKEFLLVQKWAAAPRGKARELARAAGLSPRAVGQIVQRLHDLRIARVVPEVQHAWAERLHFFQLNVYGSAAAVEAASRLVPEKEFIESLSEPTGVRIWGHRLSLARVLALQAELESSGVDRLFLAQPVLTRIRVPPLFTRMSWSSYTRAPLLETGSTAGTDGVQIESPNTTSRAADDRSGPFGM